MMLTKPRLHETLEGEITQVGGLLRHSAIDEQWKRPKHKVALRRCRAASYHTMHLITSTGSRDANLTFTRDIALKTYTARQAVALTHFRHFRADNGLNFI